MNRITKKKTLTTVAILLTVALFSTSFTIPKFTNSDFGDITKKAYYKSLFSSSEIKKLAKARKAIEKSEKTFAEVEKMLQKAKTFNRLKTRAKKSKDKKRAARKERKILKKAHKKAFKAYVVYLKNLGYMYNTYGQRLRKFKVENDSYHRAAKASMNKAQELYTQSREFKAASGSNDGKTMYDALKKSGEKSKEAVTLQETALMLFKRDTQVEVVDIVDDSDDQEENNNQNQTNNNNKQNDSQTTDNQTDNPQQNTNPYNDQEVAIRYNPEQDPNLYKSIRSEIYKKLNLSQNDKSLFKKAAVKKKRADSFMEIVDILYQRMDTIFNKIDKEPNEVEKNMLKQKAEMIEKDAFKNLISAANLYIAANDIFYEIYNTNFSKARSANNAYLLSQGSKYEASAKELKLMARSSIANANLKTYASEKYLQLMNSIQLQLSALQEQENAYAVYYGLPVTPLKNVFKNRYKSDNTNNGTVVVTNDNTSVTETEVTEVTQVTEVTEGKNVPYNKKYEYNYAGTYVYSQAIPTPTKYKPVKGTIFKVQVGIFKNLLSLKTFGRFSPISYDTYHNNPYKRFMVGEYKSQEAAEYVLEVVKGMGIKDAVIAAYKDGVRQSYKKTVQKLRKNSQYKNMADREVRRLKNQIGKPESKKLLYPDFIDYGKGPNDFARGKDIDKTKGLKYTVQIGVYKLPKTNSELKNISPLYREVTSKGIKYLAGVFSTYQDAKIQQAKMRKLGFKKAFVSAYMDGRKIPLEQAKRKTKKSQKTKPETKTDPVQQTSSLYFSVQIGAYKSVLSPEKEAQLRGISKEHNISIKSGDNGIKLYIIGQFKQYKEAKTLATELKSKYPGVFVVAFKNDKKISIAEANKLIQK